jgi:hypothetical protein
MADAVVYFPASQCWWIGTSSGTAFTAVGNSNWVCGLPGTNGDLDGDGTLNAIDTCLSIHDPEQLNTDSSDLDNGALAPGDDVTLLNGGDTLGNACDPDDDNDAVADATEMVHPIAGCASATAAMNPLDIDTDGDHLTDGWECANGSDPANSASKSLGSGITDADGDRIADLWEMRGYNGSGASTDVDGDGCHDLVELASIDGNTNVGDPDRLSVARRALGIWGPDPEQDYVLDIDKNGVVGDPDRLFVARAALLPEWLPKSCP